MKVGKRAERQRRASKPEENQKKRDLLLFGLIIAAIALIVWVFAMSKKAESTVEVAMLAQNVYKNQTVTADMFVKYDMLEGEYEKYTVTKEDGTKKRRILLWEDVDKVTGSFAAYSLQANTVAMYNNFVKSRVDNSDTVLYSFPGKSITRLEVGSEDLEAYKTFLQPGDRVNIIAVYTSSDNVDMGDGNSETIDTVRTEVVLQDAMVADLINQDGESILDIYESYNDKTVYEQAALDNDEAFKESVTPAALLVALTPEELDSYNYYLSMECEFRMSLPQRVE